jgi:hypothetical protein
MELIMLIIWFIWLTRNDFIFKAVPPMILSSRLFLQVFTDVARDLRMGLPF